MSVYRADYIIHGWKLPYPLTDFNGNEIDYFDDNLLPFIEGHVGEEFSLIVDGMCGEYVVFGKVLYRNNGYDGWEFIEISDIPLVHEHSSRMILRYKEILNIPDGVSIDMPTVFIFSHFS